MPTSPSCLLISRIQSINSWCGEAFLTHHLLITANKTTASALTRPGVLSQISTLCSLEELASKTFKGLEVNVLQAAEGKPNAIPPHLGKILPQNLLPNLVPASNSRASVWVEAQESPALETRGRWRHGDQVSPETQVPPLSELAERAQGMQLVPLPVPQVLPDGRAPAQKALCKLQQRVEVAGLASLLPAADKNSNVGVGYLVLVNQLTSWPGELAAMSTASASGP